VLIPPPLPPTPLPTQKVPSMSKHLRYQLYSHTSDTWYTPFLANEPQGLYRQLIDDLVPTWTPTSSDIYIGSQPPNHRFASAGWKLHISTTHPNAFSTLAKSVRCCRRHSAPFKVVASSEMLRWVNSRFWPRTASGKFITIYPHCENLDQIISELEDALNGYVGPRIITDRIVSTRAPIFARYGAFGNSTKLNPDGQHTPLLGTDPTSIDRRSIETNPKTPLTVSVPSPRRRDPIPLKDGVYRADQALKYSAAGGIYLAHRVSDGREVVIREARPYIGADHNGMDWRDRLGRAWRVMNHLSGSGVCAELIDFFEQGDHHFLVEERILGVGLQEFLSITHPILRADATIPSTFIDTLRAIWESIDALFVKMDEAGIIYTDVSPANFIVTPADDVTPLSIKLIDFESVYFRNDEYPGLLMETPGFRRPAHLTLEQSASSNDQYKIARLKLWTLGMMNHVLEHNIADRAMFLLDHFASKVGLPSDMYQSLSAALYDPPILTKSDTSLDLAITAHELVRSLLTDTTDGRHGVLYHADPQAYEANGLSVAHGAAGVFLACHKIGAPVPKAHTDWFERQVRCTDLPAGLFTGHAGIAWMYAERGEIDLAAHHLKIGASTTVEDDPTFYTGLAGLGMAALRLGVEDPSALEYASTALNILHRTARRGAQNCIEWSEVSGASCEAGYAYGLSGIASFLAAASRVLNHEQAASYAGDALTAAIALTETGPSGELAIATTRGRRRAAVTPYWSEGTAGVVLACLQAIRNGVLDPASLPLDELLLDVCRRFSTYSTLARGLAGMADVLIDASHLLNRPELLTTAREIGEEIARCHVVATLGGNTTVPGEFLMRMSNDYASGSAGVALLLHKLASSPDQVMSSAFLTDW